jgi:hypothetical protein
VFLSKRHVSLNAAIDEVTVMADALVDEQSLACDMIEVHGMEAVTVARDNARGAALAGQAALAKSWIRVLGVVQRTLAGGASPAG